MTTSFYPQSHGLSEQPDRRRTVLVTGAAGHIGRSLSRYAANRYDLKLMVHRESNLEKVNSFGEAFCAEVVDANTLASHFDDVDTVVHLAADSSPKADWESLRRNNIEGVYHIVTAAAEAGCRRVILASSIHAVSGYPVGYQVHADDPVNPGDLYGVSKCFAEALGRMMAEQHGLSCIALRIGGVQPIEKMASPDALWMMDAFVSPRDLNQLICRCIDDETLLFAVFNALSDNRFNRHDITETKELLGYEPQDDFTEINRQLAELHLRDTVRPHNISDR